MRLSRRVIGALLVVAGCLGAAGSAFGPSTVAAAQGLEPGGAYSGTASADGVRVTYNVDGFLVTDRFVDGGAPVAQAAVSSLESVGFASAPYPGDTALSAPGLAAGATDMPVPAYPLVASSRYPGQEEAAVEQGVVELSASSSATSSTASGSAGGPADEAASLGATRATAEVVHDESSGSVTSTASSLAEAFTVAGVFRIGRVESTATVVDAPDGEPQREVSFDVADVTIAGQTVAVTESGLALPGSTMPLPDASPLLAVLQDQGIEVRYVAAQDTPDGVVAPGVEVRVTHPVPNAPSPGVAVYRFGQVSASATGGIGTFTVGSDVVDQTAGGTGGDVVAPGVASDGAGVAGPVPATAAAPRSGAEPTGTASAALEATDHVQPTVAATPQWAKTWTMAFYLVIVLSGLVAVSGGQLIRLHGVRMPWTS